MRRFLAISALAAVLSVPAHAVNNNTLPQRFIDAVRSLKEEGRTPHVHRAGTNEYLGYLLIDVVTGKKLGDRPRFKAEKREYTAKIPTTDGSYKFAQTREVMSLEWFVELDSCARTVKPTTRPVKIRAVVGQNHPDPTMNAAYAGESTISLKNEGGKIIASVYLNANDKSWETNMFHLAEDFSFEVAVTQGSWDGFTRGQATTFAPTETGLASYRAGIEAAAKFLGDRAVQFAKTQIDSFDVYMKSLNVDLEYDKAPVIEGNGQSGVKLTQSAFNLVVWAITTWNIPSGCGSAVTVH